MFCSVLVSIQLYFGIELNSVLEKIIDNKVLEISRDFIKKEEGLKLVAYKDTKNWAICYGNNSFEGEITTKAICDRKLNKKLSDINLLAKKNHKNLTINQRVALISFYYNTGEQYHLEKMLNSDYSKEKLRKLWIRYNRAGDVFIPELLERREREINLFFSSIYKKLEKRLAFSFKRNYN